MSPLQESYNRRFVDKEVELRREIAEDRRKIAARQRRHVLLESWIGQRISGAASVTG